VRAVAERAVRGPARAMHARSRSRAFAGRFSPLSTTCLRFRFFASHKAKCAELRKKNGVDVGARRVCTRLVRVLRRDFEPLPEGIGSMAFAVPVLREENESRIPNAPRSVHDRPMARADPTRDGCNLNARNW
jgi:hypothetical protein